MSKSTLLKIAESKTAARKIASQVSLSELTTVVKNLQAAEQFLKKQAVNKEQADKAKKIKKAISMLDNMGLKPEDLGSAKTTSSARRKGTKNGRKVAPKYRITVKGVTTEWSGRGRMPVVFRDAMSKSGSLNKYLIK